MLALMTLRHAALELLRIRDPDTKARQTLALADGALPSGTGLELQEPPSLPGRPKRPELVAPQRLVQRSAGSPEGRIALLHALAHIEHNAINLALDACWRFSGMPEAYYRDWFGVAREEARHYGLLRDHLASLGARYGDLPAHDGLWEMVLKTRGDVLARMALVPRTLEARGLDASPAVRQRLASAGDRAGAAIIDIILRDEIGHVAIGNRWFHHLCAERQLEPVACYADLSRRYQAPVLFGPFNLPARKAAGFSDAELSYLEQGHPRPTTGALSETRPDGPNSTPPARR